MAKELLIVFLYDTECNLREDEDPQTAVVYFHPSWVNANQRMALCGQLIGVTQFLITVFSFPRIISLQTGKFTMKKIGRYILCVGTDRNIADSVLEKRSEILYNTLLFFHDDLSMFHTQYTLEVGLEKLTNAMEMYLPTLLYAGNILGNSITIRLPKSGSSIFLEAAQIIECLQDKNGVYGGAIFYQNRVLMSQLSTDVTKQLVVMDPYRIKIPVDNFETSFHLPVGVQLLIVYIDENDFKELEEQKIPTASERKTFHQEKEKEKSTSNMNNASTKLMDNARKDRSKISTVLEEEAESDHVQKNSNSELTEMPDLVKDTVRRSTKQDKRAELSNIDVQSYVVDSRKNFVKSISCSVENLEATESISLRYLSFKNSRNSDESNEKITKSFSTDKDDNTRSFPINEAFNTCKCNPYYNTISDPVNPWFRENGLPASKSLHDDRIAFYCQDIGKTQQVANADENKSDQDPKKTVELNPKRPTSIPLNLKDTSQKKQKARDSDSTRKHLPEFKPPNQPFPLPPELDVPLTPLMSKLSMVDLTDPKSNIPCPKLTTPSTSKNFMGIDDTTQKKNDSCSEKENIHRSERTTRRKKLPQPERKVASRKSILFVYGYQNISIYLILDLNCGNDADLIHFLWSTCFNSVPDLERHFQQCFECVPQTQSSSSAKESYSFVNIHSEWETLQKSGSWTVQQTELLNTLHENFEDDSTITDITIRLPDSVVYANRTGDSQVFYQQAAPPVAGIPMSSDLMGVVPLKAKRRLERDHGLLLL